MEVTLFWALILALIAPFFWAVSNVLDKYVVAHRVRNAKSYTLVTALVYIIIALVIALFLDWSGIGLRDILFPALSGIALGGGILVYFMVIQKEDPSHVIGMAYLYPLLVIILSFVFLGERLSMMGYVGAALVIFGALMLSARLRKIKLRTSIWMIIAIILGGAFYEFFLKMAADNISIMHGLAVNEFFVGITAMFIIFRKDARKDFLKEVRKIKWSFLSEGFIFLSIAMAYAAMIRLPVAFVSSVAATQPLSVLVLEVWAHKYFGKMSRDSAIRKKAISISVMVLGIILLYISAPSL